MIYARKRRRNAFKNHRGKRPPPPRIYNEKTSLGGIGARKLKKKPKRGCRICGDFKSEGLSGMTFSLIVLKNPTGVAKFAGLPNLKDFKSEGLSGMAFSLIRSRKLGSPLGFATVKRRRNPFKNPRGGTLGPRIYNGKPPLGKLGQGG